MGKDYVGIDIGTSSVKMALCNGRSVVSTAKEPLPDNMIVDGKILSPGAMGDFLSDMRREHKIRCKDAAIVLRGSDVFCRQISIPPMTAEQLNINLPYEFQDFIRGEKDKYFYDYAVLGNKYDEESPSTIKEIEIIAAVTSKENIEEYREMLNKAGMKLRIAIPEEMAWANLLRGVNSQYENEFAIMDIGHSGTRLHLYHGHKLEMTKEVEHAGATIDRAIAQGKGVDEHIARTYKESNYENIHHLDECASVYGAISIEIMKALNFHSYEHRDNHLKTVYYCGGGVNIKPLVESIGRAISLPLKPLNELLPFIGSEGLDFAAAVGMTQQ